MRRATRLGPGRPALLLAAVAFALGADLWAHTLPISFVTLVPEADYLHLELTINPFELSFFSEIDRNHNGRLESTELAAAEASITRKLLGALALEVDGRRLEAEVAGINADPESHHFALRAHYPADTRNVPLRLTSTLAAETSGSHLTQVTYRLGERTQAARLDTQSSRVTFEPFNGPGPGSDLRGAPVARRAHPPSLLLLALAGAGIILGLAAVMRLRAGPLSPRDKTL
jgi:hypothetical protein